MILDILDIGPPKRRSYEFSAVSQFEICHEGRGLLVGKSDVGCFFPKILVSPNLGLSPKKLSLIVHICIHVVSYKTYTFFDTHKNIDIMVIIITNHLFLYFSAQMPAPGRGRCLPLNPRISGGTIKLFLG